VNSVGVGCEYSRGQVRVRVISICYAVVLSLCCVSCGKNTVPVGSSSLPSIAIGRGFDGAPFGSNSEKTLAILGAPDRKTATAHEYTSQGYAVMFRSNGGMNCIILGGALPDPAPCAVKTKEGIGIGSTGDSVKTAYGEPSEKSQKSGCDVWTYNQLRTVVTLRNGSVIRVEFRQAAGDGA